MLYRPLPRLIEWAFLVLNRGILLRFHASQTLPRHAAQFGRPTRNELGGKGRLRERAPLATLLLYRRHHVARAVGDVGRAPFTAGPRRQGHLSVVLRGGPGRGRHAGAARAQQERFTRSSTRRLAPPAAPSHCAHSLKPSHPAPAFCVAVSTAISFTCCQYASDFFNPACA